MCYQVVRGKEVTKPVKFHFAHVFQSVNPGLKVVRLLIWLGSRTFPYFPLGAGFLKAKVSKSLASTWLRCYSINMST